MNNDFFSSFTDSNGPSFEKFQKLADINTRAVRKLGEIQFTLANLSIEGSLEQSRLIMTGGSDYRAMADAGTSFATSFASKLLAVAQSATDVATEFRTEYMEWVGGSMTPSESAPSTQAAPKSTETRTPARRKSAKKAA